MRGKIRQRKRKGKHTYKIAEGNPIYNKAKSFGKIFPPKIWPKTLSCRIDNQKLFPAEKKK